MTMAKIIGWDQGRINHTSRSYINHCAANYALCIKNYALTLACKAVSQ
jgi:hypothetical protein